MTVRQLTNLLLEKNGNLYYSMAVAASGDGSSADGIKNKGRHVIMKKKAIVFAVLMISILIGGCSQAKEQPSESTGSTTQQETVSAETTAATEPVVPTEPSYADLYAVDDTWEKGSYTNIDEVTADLWARGFREICLKKAEIPDPDLGTSKITNIEYYIKESRICLFFAYTMYPGTENEMSIPWEVHMEQTNEPKDISTVEKLGYWYPMIVLEGMENMDYGRGDETFVQLFYAPRTGNMYTLQSNEYIGGHTPPMTSPSILFYHPGYKPEKITKEFTITLGDGQARTYRHYVGETFVVWCLSDDNTGGWQYVADSEWILSKDGKYAVWGDTVITPNMQAQPYPVE